MRKISRRAINGADGFHTVPTMARSIHALCQHFKEMAQNLGKNRKIYLNITDGTPCQPWHINIIMTKKISMCLLVSIYLIFYQFVFGNQHCEMCAALGHINDK